MTKVFLGGTCNESRWREALIPKLRIDSFNPVVDDWNEAAQQRELHERATCDFVLYCITPRMTGVYSIAEVVDDSNKRPETTILVVLDHDTGVLPFNKSQILSLEGMMRLVAANGAHVFSSLSSAADVLNHSAEVAP